MYSRSRDIAGLSSIKLMDYSSSVGPLRLKAGRGGLTASILGSLGQSGAHIATQLLSVVRV